MLGPGRRFPLGCECAECAADPLYADSCRLMDLLDRMFERIAVARGARPAVDAEAAFNERRRTQLRHPARWTWREKRVRRLLLVAAADELKVVLCGYEAELERLRFELELVDVHALVSIDRHGCEYGKRFDIRTARGPVHSLCMTFDLEDWLFAVHERWGLDPRDWPRPLRRELAEDEESSFVAVAQ